MYKFFNDEEKMKQDLVEIAQNAVPQGKFVMINLYLELGIGAQTEGYGKFGEEPSDYKRDQNVELQKVYISKPQNEDQKGQYMRIVKKHQSDLKSNLMISFKKSVQSNEDLIDSVVSLGREKPPNPYFEFAFTLLLELIAMLDMVGDIYLTIGMYKHGHTAWFTVSIFTMLSPFYVCYVPLVTF